MKVVCESCQAKYQVPDERVAGKKLKIRCKRCGATVLIRGDLTQIGLSDAPQPTAEPADLAPAVPAAELEWHASIEGQSYGPFDTSTLLRWLDEQPGGWDAHVWRDGFSDWVEVRSCPELMAAAPAAAPVYDALPAPPDDSDEGAEAEAEAASLEHEDEGPTRTFQNDDVLGARRPSPRSSDDLRARASSIRTRSSPALTAVPAAAVGSVGSPWSSGQAAAASPRVTAAQAMTGERHEDSVLFSTANLQQVAMTTSQPGYGPGSNPGFASGEASGLIDIRALASLARQNQPQIAPGAAYDRFRADDDSRMAVMNQTGAFNRVDSLAPVSDRTSTSSSAAVPLAILGGFALVAAAAFAAILITREAKGPETAAAVVPETTAATAQPTVTPEPTPTPTTMPAAAAPEPAKAEEKVAEPAAPAPESEELANGKAAKRRSSRTAEEKGAKDTMPADKAKPKKEEKAPPPSLDEVMLAEKPKPAKPEKVEPEPKHEPAKTHTSTSDIDDLLGGTSKPAAKTAPKSRSIDDLLDTAVDDKKAAKPKEAPAPAPAAAAASKDSDDLPESPSRDEVLAAMRGVESAVRACASPETKGTAIVEISVSGSSGRVTNATVTGITGEPGSCIARAARNAKFPHFAKSPFQVKYPYRFQ
ncbi:MAG TPA: zinc-ribbon domain-containing protein [Polyangiales bacterium]|nr:zinc-ribbon domain-containing protein [Polyangiales bacterium]